MSVSVAVGARGAEASRPHLCRWLSGLLALALLVALSWSEGVTTSTSIAPPRVRTTVARALPLPLSAVDSVLGIYVVYRRPKAFLAASQSFRDAYPDAALFLVCDAGCHDYRAVASGLRATWLGPFALTIKNGRMFLSTTQMMTLFGVWRDVLARTTEPFFMHLEDDVRVIKRIASPLEHDLNGAVTFALLSPALESWILARNPTPYGRIVNKGALWLGGMGGNVFRSSFWRTNLARPNLERELESLITETGSKNIDAICSALTYAWNGTVGFYDGYGPGWSEEMGEKWWKEKIEVVHDDKSTYNVPLTSFDLAALGPNWNTSLHLEGAASEVDIENTR